MIRCYVDGSYEVQCPTCRQGVRAGRAEFDGEIPLRRHSRWAPSWVQNSFAAWPTILQRKGLLRLLVRVEIVVRTLNAIGEPACDDVTPRRYRDWLPDGFGHVGPLV